jgi:hypothetical protein
LSPYTFVLGSMGNPRACWAYRLCAPYDLGAGPTEDLRPDQWQFDRAHPDAECSVRSNRTGGEGLRRRISDCSGLMARTGPTRPKHLSRPPAHRQGRHLANQGMIRRRNLLGEPADPAPLRSQVYGQTGGSEAPNPQTPYPDGDARTAPLSSLLRRMRQLRSHGRMSRVWCRREPMAEASDNPPERPIEGRLTEAQPELGKIHRRRRSPSGPVSAPNCKFDRHYDATQCAEDTDGRF